MKIWTVPNIISFLSLIVAFVSAFFAWSGTQIAGESNQIAKETRAESRDLFLLEKRPYIDVNIEKGKGEQYLHLGEATTSVSVGYSFENKGGLPARELKTVIQFFNVDRNVYETMRISFPELQKVLSGEKLFGKFTISPDENTSIEMFNAIAEQKLQFQIQIQYKSDVDDKLSYTTTRNFAVTPKAVNLVGSLGEYK